MLGKRHEIAHLQSDFYRYKFYKILRWLIYTIVIIFLLIAVIIYLILFQPERKFYASTTDGQILTMPEARSAK